MGVKLWTVQFDTVNVEALIPVTASLNVPVTINVSPLVHTSHTHHSNVTVGLFVSTHVNVISISMSPLHSSSSSVIVIVQLSSHSTHSIGVYIISCPLISHVHVLIDAVISSNSQIHHDTFQFTNQSTVIHVQTFSTVNPLHVTGTFCHVYVT